MFSAIDASKAGNLERAVEQLETAVRLYPESNGAWQSLADTYERVGDWEKAFRTWNSILTRARDKEERDIADSCLRRVNEERIISRLNGAVEAASNKEYEEALGILVDAANLSPSDGILHRIRNQYYDIYASALRSRLLGEAKSRGWSSAAAAALSKGPISDGYSLRDRICASFRDNDPFRVKALSVSGQGLSLLREGQYERLSEADRDTISKSRAEAIVFVIIDDQVSSYVFDMRQKETVPIIDSPSVGFVPGLPVNVSAWSCLPEKRHTNSRFRTEVWTRKTRFAIGDEVTFYVRSNVDCYVTLVDVQPNGDLYILLPNAHRHSNSLKANAIFTIPSTADPFTIVARQPAGVEAVKLIASTQPIQIAGVSQGDGFAVARTPAEQQEMCRKISESVEMLPGDEWDVSTWTFEIVENK